MRRQEKGKVGHEGHEEVLDLVCHNIETKACCALTQQTSRVKQVLGAGKCLRKGIAFLSTLSHSLNIATPCKL
eukprot:1159400-Pelagomonas_calceolata.AAC.5